MESGPMNQYEEKGILLPGQFCIGIGAPGADLLRMVAGYMEKGSIALAKRHRNEESLQYSGLRGNPFFIEQLSEMLTRIYCQPVQKSDLFITCGATAGLDFLINVFMDEKRTVFVENPTYKNFASYLVMTGKVQVSCIEMEDEGMDLAELEKQVSALPELQLTELKPFRALVYVIPVHHNPTGRCYSKEKCRKLVEIARKYKLLVVCDDVYNCLSYETDPKDPDEFLPPLQRIFAYDNKQDPDYEGNVISNGSFSKIAGPGLRLGWFELPERVAKQLMDTFLVQSGTGMSAFLSSIMAEVIASGDFENHVKYLRETYKKRMDETITLIERRVGKLGVKVSHPSGGLFLWIELPQGVAAADVLEVSSKSNVTFTCGPKTSVTGDFTNFIRISYACYKLPELLEGVELMCSAIEQTMKR